MCCIHNVARGFCFMLLTCCDVICGQVANYARVADSIVGWGSSLGKWTRVEFKSVIGEDVHVRPEVFLNGSIVLPHKEIKESIMDPGTIIM